MRDASNSGARTGPVAIAGGGARQRVYGGGMFSGGAIPDAKEDEEVLRQVTQYYESLARETKEKVIRLLAEALQRAGTKIDPKADLDTIVAHLREKLPSAANMNSFAPGKSIEPICMQLAAALNTAFTPGAADESDQLINMRLKPQQICRQVLEWVNSFTQGVNVEFVRVHAAVRNVRHNLLLLDGLLTKLYDELVVRVRERNSSAEADSAIATLDHVYRLARAERDRQMIMLDNILKIDLPPAEKALELALRTKNSLDELIGRIDGDGDKHKHALLADALTRAVSGLTTVAVAAREVDKALSKVGMSIREYSGSSSLDELEKALDKLRDSSKHGDVVKFMDAAAVLRRHFRDRAEIADYQRSDVDRLVTGAGRGGHAGGAERPLTVDERVAKRDAERKILVSEFSRRLSASTKKFCEAIDKLSVTIGFDTPIGDMVDMLRDALQRVQAMFNGETRYELALMGMFTDSASREHKDKFVSGVGAVRKVIGEMLGMDSFASSRAVLKSVDDALDAMLKDIEFFNSTIVQRYGAIGGAGDAGDAGDAAYSGGAGSVSDFLPQARASSVQLAEAIGMFVYRNYTAHVRSNLSRTAEDIKKGTENYPAVLGDAVASRLQKLREDRDSRIKILEDVANGGIADGPQRQTIKESIEENYSSTVELYKALQAIDLYLREFSISLGSDSEALRDLVGELNSVQIIANWFLPQTGDDIAAAFDAGTVPTAAAAPQPISSVIPPAPDKSYLERAVTHASTLPADTSIAGDPYSSFASATPERNDVKTAKASIKRAFERLQALKNLINAFARIGDKFSGGKIRERIFMTPAQIYKALITFMMRSSLVPTLTGDDIDAQTYGEANTRHVFPKNTIHYALAIPKTYPAAAAAAPAAAAAAAAKADLLLYDVEIFYLSIAMRAVVGKILTAVGVYRLIERRTPLTQLTPLRITVGGGSEDVRVIAEASELYCRLPRLVELYSDLFGWSSDLKTNASKLMLTMLPDVDGVFGGLIRTIFTAGTIGEYTNSEIKDIIREINSIYKHFSSKSPDSFVRSAVIALITEVNRRYGIIKREELSKFRESIIYGPTGSSAEAPESIDYSVLPDEEDGDTTIRAAPSDRYSMQLEGLSRTSKTDDPNKPQLAGQSLEERAIPPPGAPGEPGEPTSTYQIVYELRTRLSKMFGTVQPQNFSSISFRWTIDTAQREIEAARSEEDKFAVAVRLIRSGGHKQQNSTQLLMVHETISTVLSALYGVSKVLDGFVDVCRGVDASALLSIFDKYINAILNSKIGRPNDGTIGSLMARLRKIDDVKLAERDPKINPVLYADHNRLGLADSPTNNVTIAQLVAAFHAILASVDVPANDDGTGVTPVMITALKTGKRLDALKACARHIVDYNLSLQAQLEAAFSLKALGEGLVDVRAVSAEDGVINIDFSKLRSICEELLLSVRRTIDAFRLELDKDVVANFENKSNKGSVFWLEENLMDKLLRPRTPEARKNSLDAVVQEVNNNLRALVVGKYPSLARSNVDIDAAAVAGAADAGRAAAANGIIDAVKGADDENSRMCFSIAFSRLVYYYQSDITGNGIGARSVYNRDAAADRQNLQKAANASDLDYQLLRSTATDSLIAPGTTLYVSDIITPDDTKFSSTAKGVMLLVNDLVAALLNVGCDKGNNFKIYKPLISGIAEGVVASIVGTISNGWPDMFQSAAGGVFDIAPMRHGDPKITGILAQSLAAKMQRITRDSLRSEGAIYLHLVMSLADLPLYVKESLRCNLPWLKQLATTVISKIDLIRTVMETTAVNVSRRALLERLGPNNGMVLNVNSEDTPAEKNNTVFTQYLREVMASCMALAQAVLTSVDQVLRELNDEAVHFGVELDAIQTYKQMNDGVLPVMPMSLGAFVLGAQAQNILLPVHKQGTGDFGVAYGLRYILLNNSPSIKGAPYARALLDEFNSTASTETKMETGQFDTLFSRFAKVIRFIAGARLISAETDTVLDNTVKVSAKANDDRTEVPVLKSHFQTVSASDIAQLVRARDRATEIDKIVQSLVGVSVKPGSTVGATARKTQLIHNVLDLNVVPINVQALQRQVPLFNIMNYDFAFRSFLCDMLGLQLESVMKSDGPKITRTEFARLLISPYEYRDFSEYIGFASSPAGAPLQRVLRGADGLGLGRPKFISDVLLGVLFQSPYYSGGFDEAGPVAGFVDQTGGALTLNFIPLLSEYLNYMSTVVGVIRGIPDIPSDDEKKKIDEIKVMLRKYITALDDKSIDNFSRLILPIDSIEGRNIVLRVRLYLRMLRYRSERILHLLANIDSAAALEQDVADDNIILAMNTALTAVLDTAITTVSERAVAVNGDRINPADTTFASLKNALQNVSAGISTYKRYIEDQLRGSRDRITSVTPVGNTIVVATKADKNVALNRIVYDKLQRIGHHRFNTLFVRHMLFTTNLQRVLRIALHRLLTNGERVITVTSDLVGPAITEYGADPYDPNEAAGDHKYGAAAFDI